MTAEKMYKLFVYGSMMGVIVFSFALGAIFPSLSGFFFLGLAVICGAIILFVSKRIQRRSLDALSDERMVRNYEKATSITCRVTLLLTMFAAILILNIAPKTAVNFVAAGRALMLIAVFQSLFLTTAYFIIDRKSR
jgi:uncharacterized membrane protein